MDVVEASTEVNGSVGSFHRSGQRFYARSSIEVVEASMEEVLTEDSTVKVKRWKLPWEQWKIPWK